MEMISPSSSQPYLYRVLDLSQGGIRWLLLSQHWEDACFGDEHFSGDTGNIKASGRNMNFPKPASLHKSLLSLCSGHLLRPSDLSSFPCIQPQLLFFPTQAQDTSYPKLLAILPSYIMFPYASVTFIGMSFSLLLFVFLIQIKHSLL